MKIIISKVGQFWRTITIDREAGTVERLFVPSKILQFILNYLRRDRHDAD